MKKLLLLAAIAAAALTTGCTRHNEGGDIGAKPVPTTPSILTENVLKEDVIYEDILTSPAQNDSDKKEIEELKQALAAEQAARAEAEKALSRYEGKDLRLVGCYSVANCTTTYNVLYTWKVWSEEKIIALSEYQLYTISELGNGNVKKAITKALGKALCGDYCQNICNWKITLALDKNINGFQFAVYTNWLSDSGMYKNEIRCFDDSEKIYAVTETETAFDDKSAIVSRIIETADSSGYTDISNVVGKEYKDVTVELQNNTDIQIYVQSDWKIKLIPVGFSQYKVGLFRAFNYTDGTSSVHTF